VSHYFSVAPIGLGTLEVECLSSYLLRLAVAHGVTRYQFVCHLRSWWHRTSSKTLPRCEELRWNGYSPNVSIAIAALRDATGIDLGPTTLIALKDVCAGNCTGAIRRSRVWCPACYREDLEKYSFVYDRLLWQLQAYKRCSKHRYELIAECPQCRSLQINDRRNFDPHLCSSCGFDLSRIASKRHYRPDPAFGEVHLEKLVETLATKPRFAVSPLLHYLESLKSHGIDIVDIETVLGELSHRRTVPPKPQLNSLVAAAVYFDSDLTSILQDPRQAARQLPLGIGTATVPRARRPPYARNRRERADWFKKLLEAAVNGPPPYPSLKDFCRQHNYTASGASGFHRKLASQLIRKRAEWLHKEKMEMLRRVKAQLSRARRSNLTVRELVRQVSIEVGAPIHIVRRTYGSVRR